MHISEGVLDPAVLGVGAALAAAGTALGLRRLDPERLIVVALLSAVFFVGSLVHVPVGAGASAHLVLNGLPGMLLGWAAFPCILTALILQALLFQFGGFAVLGVNTFNMAFPAVLTGLAFRLLPSGSSGMRQMGAFCCGALSVAGAALLTALSLMFTHEGFALSAAVLFAAHLPIMVAEGLVTAAVFAFLTRVRPELAAGI